MASTTLPWAWSRPQILCPRLRYWIRWPRVYEPDMVKRRHDHTEFSVHGSRPYANGFYLTWVNEQDQDRDHDLHMLRRHDNLSALELKPSANDYDKDYYPVMEVEEHSESKCWDLPHCLGP